MDALFASASSAPHHRNIFSSLESYGRRQQLEITDVVTRFKLDADVAASRPTGLNRLQRLLLSRDFDDAEPYLQRVTPLRLFRASRNREFGTLRVALEVAQSLTEHGIDTQGIADMEPHLCDAMERVAIPPDRMQYLERLFDAVDRRRPVSVWDFALAAVMLDVTPESLGPSWDYWRIAGGM